MATFNGVFSTEFIFVIIGFFIFFIILHSFIRSKKKWDIPHTKEEKRKEKKKEKKEKKEVKKVEQKVEAAVEDMNDEEEVVQRDLDKENHVVGQMHELNQEMKKAQENMIKHKDDEEAFNIYKKNYEENLRQHEKLVRENLHVVNNLIGDIGSLDEKRKAVFQNMNEVEKLKLGEAELGQIILQKLHGANDLKNAKLDAEEIQYLNHQFGERLEDGINLDRLKQKVELNLRKLDDHLRPEIKQQLQEVDHLMIKGHVLGAAQNLRQAVPEMEREIQRDVLIPEKKIIESQKIREDTLNKERHKLQDLNRHLEPKPLNLR